MTSCCVPWPVVWPCDALPVVTDEQRAAAVSAATTLLWSRTGRRLGLCQVTEVYWPAAGGGCGSPYMSDDRVWHNAGRTGGSCCAIFLLQQPVVLVTEVKVNGVVLDPAGYRLDGSVLSRVGSCWPPAAECDGPPVEVTYTWGVPLNGDLWGLAAAAVGEVAVEFMLAMCGQPCRLPSRAVSVTRQGVTVELAGAEDFGVGLVGMEMADSLILAVNPGRLRTRSRVYSPDMGRGVVKPMTSLPGAQSVGGVSTVTLPVGYEGEDYEFSMTFPDASFLAGAPANVDAEVKVNVGDLVAAATFTPSVVGATLTLRLSPNPLLAGSYWTDVQVGGTTYLRKTRVVIAAQVSV